MRFQFWANFSYAFFKIFFVVCWVYFIIQQGVNSTDEDPMWLCIACLCIFVPHFVLNVLVWRRVKKVVDVELLEWRLKLREDEDQDYKGDDGDDPETRKLSKRDENDDQVNSDELNQPGVSDFDKTNVIANNKNEDTNGQMDTNKLMNMLNSNSNKVSPSKKLQKNQRSEEDLDKNEFNFSEDRGKDKHYGINTPMNEDLNENSDLQNSFQGMTNHPNAENDIERKQLRDEEERLSNRGIKGNSIDQNLFGKMLQSPQDKLYHKNYEKTVKFNCRYFDYNRRKCDKIMWFSSLFIGL